MSEKQKPEDIQCPGSFQKNEDWMFEQTKKGFVYWDKKGNQELSLAPSHNFVGLAMCPWNLPEGLEEYGDDDTLWREVYSFIADHVFLPDDRLYDVLTAWVHSTWLRERWDVVPYLLMKGPISSGKTRLLEVLNAISFRGIMASNISGAALFRASQLWTPTLFLDETEIYNKDQRNDVVGLLNAGYRKGQFAIRVRVAEGGITELECFDVFGFKALAGTQGLAQALESRAIIVDMVRNQKRINFRVNQERAEKVRGMLLLYRFRKLSCLKADENDDFDETQEKLASLNDGRLMELFACLLKVSNSGRESILSYAQYLNKVRESEGQTSLEAQVLESLIGVKDKVEAGKLLVKHVKEKLNLNLPEKEHYTTQYVTKVLSNLGFKKTHLENGIGIVWDDRMVNYRAMQYRFTPLSQDTTLLPKSSESSESSATIPITIPSADENDENDEVRGEVCQFCLKSLPEDWVDCTTYGGKKVHIPCMRKHEESTFNPNLGIFNQEP